MSGGAGGGDGGSGRDGYERDGGEHGDDAVLVLGRVDRSGQVPGRDLHLWQGGHEEAGRVSVGLRARAERGPVHAAVAAREGAGDGRTGHDAERLQRVPGRHQHQVEGDQLQNEKGAEELCLHEWNGRVGSSGGE
uniref:(northern house mosquito) hypothetical protein n=1 Tax=Culex pipiens TaxID=7175 RepID=A0A8D8NGX6_CULPI